MGTTPEIARALAAATDHLRRHPEAGRVADRTGPRPWSSPRAALPGHRPAEGIELERVEVSVASESDHRGLLGLDGVSPGPFGLRVRYRLSAPGVPPERLRALVDWAERHSPVAAAARRPLPVSVELETG